MLCTIVWIGHAHANCENARIYVIIKKKTKWGGEGGGTHLACGHPHNVYSLRQFIQIHFRFYLMLYLFISIIAITVFKIGMRMRNLSACK